MAGDFVRLVADFVGVPAAQLGDRTLLSGLLIAAASATGLAPIGIPADSRRALDVFVRRLTAREVRSDKRERG